MINSNLKCPSCNEVDLVAVSSDSHIAQKYDYKETTQTFYYKCANCEKMFDEVIKSTGIRPLALNRYPKAEKLVNQ
jgi:DNA-directed RNA polymerase subunit RPC12/RpoP